MSTAPTASTATSPATSPVVFDPPLFADLPALRLAYREWGPAGAGDERPVVLLVHGITSSSLSWARVGPALGQQYRVIAPDLKGHGDSERPPKGYRIEHQAAEMAALCAALGLSRVRVVGHSWGGAIALHLATASDLVERLVLEDPALAVGEAGRERGAVAYSQQVGLKPEVAAARVRDIAPPSWTEADVAGKIDAMVKGSPDAVRAVLVENEPWDVRPRLRHLRCPTLLIRAEPQLGGLVDDATATAAERASPLVRATVVPNADHNVHRTQFDAFMALTEPFLAGS